MDEGVEAGEDEQRHHGAQRHHVVELGLQHAARVPVLGGRIRRLVGGARGGVLQPAGEVLKKKKGDLWNSKEVQTQQTLSGGSSGLQTPPPWRTTEVVPLLLPQV